ncbi:DUF1318 domain-containing protein [candidate division KSB1 bacterium]|nr:DUF1318 domain-containing protein [candidate division KSB1 bacterium]
MKKNIWILAFWVLLIISTSCSVKAPEVTVTGEKTALENQVIGTYENIEKETWMVSSVRSEGEQKKVVISDEKKRVLEAVQNRKFNKDEIDEYKRDGAIGENNRGFLELRPLAKLDEDADYKKRVMEIMMEENRDREVVMDRVIEINADAANASKDDVYAIFAAMNREKAESGIWIQLPDGSWNKK